MVFGLVINSTTAIPEVMHDAFTLQYEFYNTHTNQINEQMNEESTEKSATGKDQVIGSDFDYDKSETIRNVQREAASKFKSNGKVHLRNSDPANW